VLLQQLRGRRIRYTDAQRRRLGAAPQAALATRINPESHHMCERKSVRSIIEIEDHLVVDTSALFDATLSITGTRVASRHGSDRPSKDDVEA
jgi:hypothetical protein